MPERTESLRAASEDEDVGGEDREAEEAGVGEGVASADKDMRKEATPMRSSWATEGDQAHHQDKDQDHPCFPSEADKILTKKLGPGPDLLQLQPQEGEIQAETLLRGETEESHLEQEARI